MDFEIEVISDAAASLYGADVPMLNIGARLAAHDLEMVKPALLYADRVTLYSGNFFIASQLERLLTRTRMPMQLVALLGGLARNRRDELRKIGITDRDLPTVEDAANAMAAWAESIARSEADPDYDFVEEVVVPLASRWDPYFDRVFPRLVDALAADRAQLFSADLDAAVDAGLLEIVPHTLEPPNPNSSPSDILFGEPPLNYQDRAAAEVLIRTATSTGAVLLDPWGAELTELFGLEEDRRRTVAADIGLGLLGRLPTVAEANVSEIIGVREELSGALVRFRAAMASAARDAPPDPADRDDFVHAFYDEQVAPALVEIDERVEENSLLRQLLDVVKDPKELAVPVGGLLLASGGGLAGLLSAASGVTGLSIPVLRSMVEQRRERRQVQANPFYLLYRLRRGVGASGRP